MPLQIRRATPHDRTALHALLTAQLLEHALPADPERIERGLDAAFRSGSPAWLLLAERNGAAVGVFLGNRIVSVEQGGETLWVEELYVAPAARRSGVARALLAHAVAEARACGLRGLDLEVLPAQQAAFALYRAFGFQDVSRQRMKLSL